MLLLYAGWLELPVGEGAAEWIDADNIAEVVVALLADGGHSAEVIELSGPRAVPVREAVALIAAETGRSIEYIPSTDEAYRDRLRADGVDEGTIEQQSSGISAVRLGSETVPTDGVRQVVGREPGSFEQYVRCPSGAWR